MKKLTIIGAGGFGREVKEVVDVINEQEPTWEFVGFYDDSPEFTETIEGDQVLGTIDDLCALEEKPYVVIAIANVNARKMIARKCEEAGCQFATIIHPNFVIRGKIHTIGEGTIICGECNIAVNSHIGKHCILNTCTYLGHDTVVGDFVDLMPCTQIMGDVTVGDYCYLGVRTTVINGLSIVAHTTVGACGCVVKPITVPGTYVGVPVKMIKPYIEG